MFCQRASLIKTGRGAPLDFNGSICYASSEKRSHSLYLALMYVIPRESVSLSDLFGNRAFRPVLSVPLAFSWLTILSFPFHNPVCVTLFNIYSNTNIVVSCICLLENRPCIIFWRRRGLTPHSTNINWGRSQQK